MTTELDPTQLAEQAEHEVQKVQAKQRGGGSPDTVYALGMIGAWIYYIGRAETWGERGLGFLKGLVWPAFMVYAALKLLEKE